MDKKETLLSEIAVLIPVPLLELGAMKFMSAEELENIRDNLLKRKEQRHEEQEDWYNEWSGTQC
jgi:predicted DNA repair protein MutK